MNLGAKISWSLRRELWEHRAIFVAPLAVAALVLFAFLIAVVNHAERLRGFAALSAGQQAAAVVTPFSIAASVILFTSFIVAIFYCLDALYAERRDRSILFWKSMPVSDLLTVASKVLIAMLVLPLVAFVIALATQLVMVTAGSAIMASQGVDLGLVWGRLPILQMTVVMLYGLLVHSLWYAPIYGWLFLVSSWARKAPSLWAVLPVFAAFVVEKIGFGTSYVWRLLSYRTTGAMSEAFTGNAMRDPVTQLSQLDPLRFLSSAGLWLGLAFAVAFLAAAIQMRRHREPI